jgi:hypothetical protein
MSPGIPRAAPIATETMHPRSQVVPRATEKAAYVVGRLVRAVRIMRKAAIEAPTR